MVVVLLYTIGCVHYEPQRLDPVANSRDFARRSLADPNLTAFLEQKAPRAAADVSTTEWGLMKLSLAAFYFHPDLDVARASWTLARMDEKTSAQRPDPALALGPGFNTTTGSPSPWILSTFLDLSVETAGKRNARRDQAHHLSEAARLHLAGVAWQVRSQVRRSLTVLDDAQETGRLLALRQSLLEENVRRVEQLYEAGAVSAYRRSQARFEADQARLGWHDAERQAVEARVQLAAAVGIAPEALEGLTLSFDELNTIPAESTLAEARTQALMNRADLLEALAAYAATEDALRFEIARQYPDLQIGPGYEFDQGDNKWSVGLNIPLPFFNGNRGPITQARARRAEAAAQFDAIQLRVVESVAHATAVYRAALDKKADADAMQEQAQAQLRRTEGLLAAGELSETDLVAARLNMNTVLLAHQAVSSELRQSLGALEEAIQSPLGLPPETWQNAPRPMTAANEDR